MASTREREIIYKAAKKYGIKPSILWGVYGTETSFGRNVSVSSAGAQGPFQFMPATARSLGVNPHDFKSAAYGAARYLSQFKSRGTGGMLSAYNAGPAGGYMSSYVRTTLHNAKSWKPPSGGGGSSGGGSGGGTSLSQILRTTTTSTRDLPTLGDASAIEALLGGQSGPPQPNATAPLQSPSFSARSNLHLPAGYSTPASSGGPAPSSGDTLSQRLSAVAALGGGQVPHTTVTGSQSLSTALKGSGSGKAQNQYGGRLGHVTIAAGADRSGVHTNKAIIRMGQRIAGIIGHSLTLGTGSNHSRMTTSGNVSDHWTGNAGDFPASGGLLTMMGHAALIAAGASPSWARKQKGGVFNINGYQIIFNSHVGGNHYNHLHVGYRKGR